MTDKRKETSSFKNLRTRKSFSEQPRATSRSSVLPPFKPSSVSRCLPNYPSGSDRLNAYDTIDPLEGISIVTCCMNRNENLVRSLRSWLKLSVDEIVIVDWSSNLAVEETLKDFADRRIRVIRVNDEKKWVLTQAFNVGLRFASYTKIFKLDADIEVSPNFLELNDFSENEFIRGYWKLALDEGEASQVYVNGSFGAHKRHLSEVGYYNELIRTYGWDDSDLYERLASQCGLGSKYLELKSLVHLEQAEESRTSHQDLQPHPFLGIVPCTEFNNRRNRFIGRTTGYWDLSRLQNYSIRRDSEQYWVCQRISQDIPIHAHILNDAAIYASLQCLEQHRFGLLEAAQNARSLAELVYLEYSQRIKFTQTEALLGKGKAARDIHFHTGSTASLQERADILYRARPQREATLVARGQNYSTHSASANVRILLLPEELLNIVLVSRSFCGMKTPNADSFEMVPAGVASGIDLSMRPFPTSPEVVRTDAPKAEPPRPHSSTRKGRLYCDSQHGLGNRLRALGSAAAIAEAKGLELIVIWEPDHHCKCEFRDLFEYDGPVLNHAFITEARERGCDVFNYMEAEVGSEKGRMVTVGSKDIYTRSAYALNSPLTDWNLENKFLRSLRPAPQVEELIAPFDLNGCVGAHVRMEAGAGLDHNSYDSAKNWTKQAHQEIHEWRAKSHYSHFLRRLDEIFAQQPESRLFLATDMPETYEIFLNHYADRVSYLKRDCFDRSKKQIVYALADAILLSRCERLLGSTWSSFSELAQRLSTTYSRAEMSGTDF